MRKQMYLVVEFKNDIAEEIAVQDYSEAENMAKDEYEDDFVRCCYYKIYRNEKKEDFYISSIKK